MMTTKTGRGREMADKTVNAGGGVGFSGLLAIVFIILKLTGHIDWTWGWVLAPIWLPFAILIPVAVIGFGIYVWVKS